MLGKISKRDRGGARIDLKKEPILGIDILPGSSANDGKYAGVLLLNNRVKARFPEITKRNIIEIVKKWRVKVLAIDNLSEIAPSIDSLKTFLAEFEEPPKIVEVTMIYGQRIPLAVIARTLNMASGHPSPLITAEIAAKLAAMKVGSEVKIFENETKIMIRKAKTPVQGGMSRERYRRNVELAVLRKTKEIRQKLKLRGLDFDLFVERGEAGLKGSVFLVYAPPDKLRGIVKKRRGLGYIIKVEPVIKEKIEYVPLGSKPKVAPPPNRPLILGVDPGLWTGIALVDLSGKPVIVMSKRWLGRARIIREVSKYGRVVLVATDVNPSPSFVKKLAASLAAPLYTPPRSLTIEEKRELSQGIAEVKLRDAHQRDALAAALKAYKTFSNKFDQIASEIRKLGLQIPIDEAKVLVMRGRSIADALQELSKRYILGEKTLAVKKEISEPKVALPQSVKDYIDSLERKIVEMENYALILESENRELRDKIVKLEQTVQKLNNLQSLAIKKDKAVVTLQRQIQILREQNQRLQEKLENTSLLLEEYENLIKEILTGKIVWGTILEKLEDYIEMDPPPSLILLRKTSNTTPSLVEEAAKRGIEAVLVTKRDKRFKELLANYGIPVLHCDDLSLKYAANYFFVSREQLLKKIREETAIKGESEEEVKKKIQMLFEAYRKERKRMLSRLGADYRR